MQKAPTPVPKNFKRHDSPVSIHNRELGEHREVVPRELWLNGAGGRSIQVGESLERYESMRSDH